MLLLLHTFTLSLFFFFFFSSPELHVNHRRISLQAARSDQLSPPTFRHPVFEGTTQASDLESIHRAQTQMCILLHLEHFSHIIPFLSPWKQRAQAKNIHVVSPHARVSCSFLLFLFLLGWISTFVFTPSLTNVFRYSWIAKTSVGDVMETLYLALGMFHVFIYAFTLGKIVQS